MSAVTCFPIPRTNRVNEDWRCSREQTDDGFFSGTNPVMSRIHAQIERIAAVDVPVLLLGESGVGKEVAARMIHKLSPRRNDPFLKVNCAALPAELLESELFGYEPGAFTGAARSKPGRFELCNKGTILLDEIGEMPPALQAKLLDVLQDGEFYRLGGRSRVSVDVRVLGATNIDIHTALESKQFRPDLYYRISAVSLHIPPLRERLDEIPSLLEHLMDRVATQLGRDPKPTSMRILAACLRHRWPGNVRELENFVKRYVILDDEEAVLSELEATSGDASAKSNDAISQPNGNSPANLKGILRELKAKAEKAAIAAALAKVNGRRREAAQLLGISIKALCNKMRQYGIVDGRSRLPFRVSVEPEDDPRGIPQESDPVYASLV